MRLYRYNRLKRPEGHLEEFRFFTLFHGSFDDEIRVKIEVRSLVWHALSNKQKVETDFQWLALSYTWGDATDPSRVTAVSDDGGDSYILITRNLEEALRHIRSPCADKVLWVDAICIDQGSHPEALEERAWHVRLMHHIYARALRVIVWLGSEDGDSDFAIRSLRWLGSSFVWDEMTCEVFTWRGIYPERMLRWRNRHASSRDRQALANLLDRPWWHRVWIRQEAFLADENNSIVLCGRAWLPLADLRRAIWWITTFGLGNPRHNELLRQAHSVCLRKASDVPRLLLRTRDSDCVDPRDRVYGILGILEATNSMIPVKIDYSASNSAEKLYKDVMVQYVCRYGTLGILEHAGLWQGTELRPTWVPDWRGRGERAVTLHLENATSHFDAPECTFLDADVLRVLGSCAGRVSKVHLLEPVKLTKQSEQESWRELAMLFFHNPVSVAAQVAIGHASSVLCSILPTLDGIQPDIQFITAEIEQYVTYLYGEALNLNQDHRRLLKMPTEVLSYGASDILAVSVGIIRSRRSPLLFLHNGYFGLGPTGVKLNDEVWAILGSRALIVLRKALNENSYAVVGPCSVHGFNSGEAILGPLPEEYTAASHLDKSEGLKELLYLNTTTGKASRWDPRIAWAELEAHPPMADYSFDFPLYGEPPRVRPDSEYLRRHNIHIEYIHLV